MMEVLHKNWWVWSIHGVLFVMFGLLALLARVSTEGALFVYFGMVLAGLGTAMLILSIRFKDKLNDLWFWIALAAMDLGAGGFILLSRAKASEAFQYALGIWLAFMGISLIWISIKGSAKNALMIVNGAISLAFGAIIIFDPFQSEEFMNFVTGFGTIALGLYIIVLSFRLRQKRTIESPEA